MRGLTQCSTGHLAAARPWPSFHSGPSAVCRKAPVNTNVRPRKCKTLARPLLLRLLQLRRGAKGTSGDTGKSVETIRALFAATLLAVEPPQSSLWFALRAAVLRLAVRGLCPVVRVIAVPVVQSVALGRFNSPSAGPGTTMQSWPAAPSPAPHARTMPGLTQCSTGHLAAAHAWPSFHSGPSAVCRKAPVTLYVRPSRDTSSSAGA